MARALPGLKWLARATTARAVTDRIVSCNG